MAEIKKIKLSGTTYDIVDASALHTLDNTVTSGGTNAVKGSGIYDAITASTAAALQSVSDAGYQTSGDVQNAISGKADTTAVTEAIDAAVSGKADSSAVTADIAAAVSGKVDTTDFNTYTSTTVPTLLSNKADVSALTTYFGAVNYDSNTKRINFYNESTTGTVLAYVDATDFIKDGMVDNVEIKTISGASYLAITFNSDAGKEEIDIPLTDIFDPSNYYNKSQIDAALSGKQDTLIAGDSIKISGNTISGIYRTTSVTEHNDNIDDNPSLGDVTSNKDIRLNLNEDSETYSIHIKVGYKTGDTGDESQDFLYIVEGDAYNDWEPDPEDPSQANWPFEIDTNITTEGWENYVSFQMPTNLATEEGSMLKISKATNSTLTPDWINYADISLDNGDYRLGGEPRVHYVETVVNEEPLSTSIGNLKSAVSTLQGNVASLQVNKQNKLTAGNGIQISGNTISVTGAPLTMDDTVTSGSSNPVKSSGIYNAITAATATKQDTLVSGTNIKTVGNTSVLGSGNIALMTASIGTGDDAETLIFDFA